MDFPILAVLAATLTIATPLVFGGLGALLGATVTEMTRTFRRQLWRLEDHLDRLFGALKYTRMEIGLSREELASVSRELVAHNTSLLSHPDDELGLIHFVTAGEYATYAGSAGGGARTRLPCMIRRAASFGTSQKRARGRSARGSPRRSRRGSTPRA